MRGGQPKDSRPSILIIDDEKMIQRTIVRAFKNEFDFTVEICAGRALESDLDKYDLIICDLMMPKFNGIEFYLELEKDGRATSRMVFMTGGALDYEVKQFIAAHHEDVLLKPFGLEDFREFVHEALERRR